MRFPDRPFLEIEERTTFYFDGESCYERDDVWDILASPGFWLSQPTYEGAVEAVKEIDALPGVDVYICTSPFAAKGAEALKRCHEEKKQWVVENFGESWLEKLYITRHKEDVTFEKMTYPANDVRTQQFFVLWVVNTQ